MPTSRPKTERDVGVRQWAVLGAIAERPTHGYVITQMLAPEGVLGQIWTLSFQDVYKCIKQLVKLGFVAERGVEQGPGPERTVVAVTPRGRRSLHRFLQEPVEHVRDARSLLLLKLTLLDRAGADMGQLLDAQEARFQAVVEALEARRRTAGGAEQLVVQWRLSLSRAARDSVRDLGRPNAGAVGAGGGSHPSREWTWVYSGGRPEVPSLPIHHNGRLRL
jgi:DNA-binding PadR family transcriptional regulator